jgi:NADH-quinone oxidoreductase subunit C
LWGLEIVAESSNENANVVADCLRAWNPKAVAEVVEFRDEKTIVVPAELLRGTAERCRDDARLKFNLLSDATCVDRFPSEPRFELNYHLVSIPRRNKVRLRVRLRGHDPEVDSLVPVWPGANWLEREIFDLFGIRFTGHPDLRRILLPEDWEGHPLRRDYPVVGFDDVHNAAEMFRRSSAP